MYLRVPFELGEEERSFAYLDLEMKCDDGFAAFLNGVPVASSGAPATLDWRSVSQHKPGDGEATTFQRHRLSPEALQALVQGVNVLAIHGLNVGLDSSDLIMVPRLTGVRVAGGRPLPRDGSLMARVRLDDEWSPLLVWPE